MEDWQRQRKSPDENAWKESRGLEEEDERKRFAAFEDAAKRMLKCLEDNEDLTVDLSALKEQLETPEETGISIMQIAAWMRRARKRSIEQSGVWNQTSIVV